MVYHSHSVFKFLKNTFARFWVLNGMSFQGNITLHSTNRFSCLSLTPSLPVIKLLDVIPSRSSKNAARGEILDHLRTHGYFILSYHPSSSNAIERVVAEIVDNLSTIFTPNTPLWPPASMLTSFRNTARSVYLNENDVPMYKLGFDDGTGGGAGNDKDKIREYFRVSSSNPDDCGSFPLADHGDGSDDEISREKMGRSAVVRGLNLCRYISNVLLELTLDMKLPNHLRSTAKSFTSPSPPNYSSNDDYSLLYAMNYFNSP